jgi:hypothetical protein
MAEATEVTESIQPGVSEREAAARIEAIMAQSDPEFADDQPAEESSQQTQTAQAAEPEAQAEGDVEENDQAPQEQSESESIELDYDTLIQVRGKDADGNETSEDVSLQQLVEERMLQADYTRKTQELAQQRNKSQEEANQAREAERQQYIDALETQQQLIMQLLVPDSSNLDTLAEEDPAEYLKATHRLNKINSVVQQIEARKQQTIAEQQQYWNDNVLPQQLELVKQKIPDWKDDLKPTLIAAGKRYGFSEEEMGQVWDARQIHLLHDLDRLHKLEDSLSAQKKVAQKKIVQKPKVVKAGRTQPVQEKGQEAKKRLRKSGRWQDAVQYFYETDSD